MMWLLIAAAVIAAVVVVCLTARSRSARGTDARATATDVLATAQVCEDNKLMTDDADRVVVRLLDGNRALVFGHSTGADTIGSTVSTLPETIAKGLIRGNAGLQAMLGAGEASGRLVMLTAESAAQLKALGPVRDAAGATLGVVRAADGRWSNILRFGQPDKLATIASLGSALSAVALQMQLAAISKQLQGIQESVDRIEQNQDDELASSVETNLALAMADYERLQQTGRISDTQWALIAARSKSVEDNVRRLSKRLERIVSELEAVPGKNGNDSAGDRLPRIDKVAKRRPVEAIDLYMRAQQSVVLGETLHVHRLISTDDPHLEIHRAACEKRVRTALTAATTSLTRFDEALIAAVSGEIGAPWYDATAWFNDYEADLRAKVKNLRKPTRRILAATRRTTKIIGAGSPHEIEGGARESDT